MKTMVHVTNLGYSSHNYSIFNSINEVVENSLEEVSVVPLNMTNSCVQINTAIHQMPEMGSFNDGMLLAFTFKDAETILSCANNSIKVLYLHDLEWMFEKIEYSRAYDILHNDQLSVIIRSEDYLEPLNKAFGFTPVGTTQCNLEDIWTLLSETKTAS